MLFAVKTIVLNFIYFFLTNREVMLGKNYFIF